MRLSIGDQLRFGWETFKKRPWFLIGAFALFFVISTIINFLLEQFFPSNGPLSFISLVAGFGSMVIGVLIEMSLVLTILRAHDGLETMTLRSVWNPQPFLPYLIGQIAVAVAVLIGLVLFIVPGLVIAAAFLFTPYIVMDKGCGPFEAMTESRRITEGHRTRLILMMSTIVLLNVCGFLALGIGLLITVPVSMLAVAHAYRTLEKNRISSEH